MTLLSWCNLSWCASDFHSCPFLRRNLRSHNLNTLLSWNNWSLLSWSLHYFLTWHFSNLFLFTLHRCLDYFPTWHFGSLFLFTLFRCLDYFLTWFLCTDWNWLLRSSLSTDSLFHFGWLLSLLFFSWLSSHFWFI